MPGAATFLPTSLLLAAVASSLPAGEPAPDFKIRIESSGAYRVAFEDLVAAGSGVLPRSPGGEGKPGLASDGLELLHRSRPVPIWVDDGGDGVFGPGDGIEFVGRRLPGESSYFNEHTRDNVYLLRSGAREPLRMTALAESAPAGGDRHTLLRERHLEEDTLLIRLPPTPDGSPQDLWFWEKMVLGREPLVRTLDLADLDAGSSIPSRLRIGLRGWSRPARKDSPEVPDHVLEVRLNGLPLATAEWNAGDEPYLMEVADLPDGRLLTGDNVLELAIPKRAQADGNAIVDVVLLNWIEVVYPSSGRIGALQTELRLGDPALPGAVELVYDGGEARVFGRGGTRRTWGSEAGAAAVRFVPKPGEETFVATAAADLMHPASVAVDRPSRLADPDNRADYIMIAHHRFLPALAPLAELHRQRGLAVTVVDVEDVYDEFNDGILDPRALRDFLEHAWRHWRKPAPRFVLLVGDASWDGKNVRAVDRNYADWTFRAQEVDHFVKNQSIPYPRDAELNHRHFIPTWSYSSYQGHSASDNAFVAFDGDDDLPDMAIGRFTVAEPQEVSDIIAKTTGYLRLSESGPWQRRILFITNELPSFQHRSNRLADSMAAAGYEPTKIYPDQSETSNEHHSEQLIEAFDQGLLAVHFLGHGGRYIWRTGPLDLKKNHDLFTLDHLDRLQPTTRLPVVLSLTCYSAPFDHPNADSIGEKLLRIPERGAIGVIAASWRNSPSPKWGEVLLDEITTPGATVGEALMRAKHRIGQPIFVNTYNLLGDPAVPVVLPAGDGIGAGEGSGPRGSQSRDAGRRAEGDDSGSGPRE